MTTVQELYQRARGHGVSHEDAIAEAELQARYTAPPPAPAPPAPPREIAMPMSDRAEAAFDRGHDPRNVAAMQARWDDVNAEIEAIRAQIQAAIAPLQRQLDAKLAERDRMRFY